MDGDRVVLVAVDDAFDPTVLAADAPGIDILRRLLSAHLGAPVEVAPMAPSADERRRSDTRNQAYVAAQAHPLVKDLLERFEAEIVAREPSPRDRYLERRGGTREAPGGDPSTPA